MTKKNYLIKDYKFVEEFDENKYSEVNSKFFLFPYYVMLKQLIKLEMIICSVNAQCWYQKLL